MKIKYRKSTLGILLSLFLINISFAQEFAPLGAKWYFPVNHCCSAWIGVMTYESIGDTIINDKVCKVLYKDVGTILGSSGNYYLHQSSDSIFQYDEFDDEFDLIIDFGAMPGDTISIGRPMGYNFLDSMYCVVDSISYISISDEDSLRVQNVSVFTVYETYSDTFTVEYENRIIEKIGFEYSLLPLETYLQVDNFTEGNVRCYEDNETDLISFSDVDCLYTFIPTSTKELKGQVAIEIYPNPVSETLFLETSMTTVDWICIIYDVYGKELQVEKNVLGQGTSVIEIDVSDWLPSMYFVTLRNREDQIYYSAKVLKK